MLHNQFLFLFSSILIILIAYLIGSVSSAIIICKLLRLPDPRNNGSGNPGATNVLRLAGKKAALVTLLCDALKGYFPVLLASCLGLPPLIIGLTGLAAFFGHLYPIYFKFKGGKGVATCLGVLFGFNVILGLIVVVSWILVFALLRYSSLAALSAMVVGLIYGWHLTIGYYYDAFATMALILFLRHRANIDRLIKGKESKFGANKKTNN